MSENVQIKAMLSRLLKRVYQRGLPYLFITLALCNGVYFTYAMLTGHLDQVVDSISTRSDSSTIK